MNDKKTKEADGRESVSMLPGVTVGVMIAVIAFVLSFDALRLVFVSSGINPLLSWGGPLCVDGTILLCTWATSADAGTHGPDSCCSACSA